MSPKNLRVQCVPNVDREEDNANEEGIQGLTRIAWIAEALGRHFRPLVERAPSHHIILSGCKNCGVAYPLLITTNRAVGGICKKTNG